MFCGGPLDKSTTASATTEPSAEHAQSQPEFPDPDDTSPQTSGYAPWEDQERLGFFEALLSTVRQTLFAPTSFFSKMPRQGGLLMPLLYAMILQSIGTMAGYVWALVLDQSVIPLGRLGASEAVLFALLIPLVLFLGLVFWAFVLDRSLYLVGGANEPFETTLRVVSYSSAPELFNAVPFVGAFVAMGWRFYLTLVGLREAQRIGFGKSLAAIILPALVCCGIPLVMLTFAIFFLGLSSGILGGSAG